MAVDSRTVRKYANQEEFKKKHKQKRIAPIMGLVKPIIDEWIKTRKRSIREQPRKYMSS